MLENFLQNFKQAENLSRIKKHMKPSWFVVWKADRSVIEMDDEKGLYESLTRIRRTSLKILRIKT